MKFMSFKFVQIQVHEHVWSNVVFELAKVNKWQKKARFYRKTGMQKNRKSPYFISPQEGDVPLAPHSRLAPLHTWTNLFHPALLQRIWKSTNTRQQYFPNVSDHSSSGKYMATIVYTTSLFTSFSSFHVFPWSEMDQKWLQSIAPLYLLIGLPLTLSLFVFW